MVFCSRRGLNIEIPSDVAVLDYLFNEELGVVIQVSAFDLEAIVTELVDLGLSPVQVARCAKMILSRFLRMAQH